MYKIFSYFALVFMSTSSTAQRVSENIKPTGNNSSYLNLFQVFFALILVIAVLLFFAWLIKKINPQTQSNKIPMKIVGGLNLGTREKIVVVEVGEEWLVLGITSHQINTLYHLSKQNFTSEELSSHSDSSQINLGFTAWLNQAIKNKKSS